MKNIRRASVKQLAYKIKGFSRQPRFAFFLGAGASRQSGVITASEMIRVFKERIYSECCDTLTTDEEKENWLKNQDWYKEEGSDYCKLFEQFEPKEIGRQRYIESIIDGQEASFGYVVLANLIANNYVNSVITTNFDDLIYSACSSYTGIRPIVYAYGVLASEMRIAAERPKILKLHGDYLYSLLKNTGKETAVQDQNMARQLGQLLSEYGLVVVGYSGGDKSILDIFETISEKNDLYWCVRTGDEINSAVEKLLEDKGSFIVEIDGFDEMMNEIRHIVGFDVGKMLGSIQHLQDRMIEKLKSFPARYSADILSETVDALKAQAKLEEEQIKKIEALSFFTQALKAQEASNTAATEALYRKAIELDPNDPRSHNNLGRLLMIRQSTPSVEAERRFLDPNDPRAHNNLAPLLVRQPNITSEEAEKEFRRAIELDPKLATPYSNLAAVLLVRGPQYYAEAETLLLKALNLDSNLQLAYGNLVYLLRVSGRDTEIAPLAEKALQLDDKDIASNLALASMHKKLGHDAESAKYAAQARQLVKPDDWYTLACLESISGNVDAAIENLEHLSRSEAFNREWAKIDPDLEWIRDDPRFIAIVGEPATADTQQTK
jgi:Flp pilus assembly protein TadD/CO dehydrogenase/acetyl-CoA synthase epsilon subunit